MQRVQALLDDPEFVGRDYKTNAGSVFKVISIDNFSYVDPVDNSTSTKQASPRMLFTVLSIIFGNLEWAKNNWALSFLPYNMLPIAKGVGRR